MRTINLVRLLLVVISFLVGIAGKAQCDVELLGYDKITHQITIVVHNSENCGCNEYTQQDGNTCDESSGIHVNNNETISNIVFGLHYVDLHEPHECVPDTNSFHPGWAYSYPEGQSTLNISNPFTTGDTITFELNTFNTWDCMLENPMVGECYEMVVWTINTSQTVDIVDFPTEYWTDTCGTCANQTQMYPDVDLSNNSLVWCIGELPPSPLYPGCMDGNASNYNPNAGYSDNSCEYFFPDADPSVSFFGNECVGEEYDPTYGVFVYNYGEDTLYQYCVEIPELSVDTCLDGNVLGAAWIEPGAAQFIGLYTIPDNITQLTVNVYNVNGEGVGDELNNTQIQNVNQPPDNPCIILDPLILDILPDEIWSYGGTCTDPFFNQNFLIKNVGEGIIDSLTFNFNVTTWDGDVILDFTQNYYTPLAPGDTLNIDDLPDVFTGDLNLVTATVTWVDENGELQTDTQTFDILLYCWGCTDPEATNYINSPYVFDAIPDHWLIEFPNITPPTPDQIECEYPLIDLSLDTMTYGIGCEFGPPLWDDPTPYWIPELQLTNQGEVPITEWCVKFQALGQFNDTICFDSPTILPGTTYTLPWPNDQIYNFDVDVNIHILHVNGESGNVINDFGFDDVVLNNMYVGEVVYNNECEPEEIPGCTIEQACNYNPEATINDGSCDFESCVGCTDPDAINYDSEATIDDGSCIDPIYGCTDPEAFNYDPLANTDDGSCVDVIIGCMIPEALNYNPEANTTCVPIDECCEFLEGCTDPFASNYNPLATVDDGSCEYVIYLGGCTDPEAINYNAQATYDDGSCVYDPCNGVIGAVYYAPNTFTPNNDGVNDGWTVVTNPECWLKWQVLIYNRWGQLIWESTTPGEVWPGSTFDGGYYVANGVYFYKVIGVGYNPLNTFQTTGNITVFR